VVEGGVVPVRSVAVETTGLCKLDQLTLEYSSQVGFLFLCGKTAENTFSIGFLDRFSARLSVFPSNENFLKYKHIYKSPFMNGFFVCT
jgi:hypothetical protein